MKKILLAICLLLSFTTAFADGHWGGGWRGGDGGWRGGDGGWRGGDDGWRGGWGGWGGGWDDDAGWIAPALLGAAVGYAVAPSQPVYVQQQPVYVQSQPIAAQQVGPAYNQGNAGVPPPRPVYKQVVEFNQQCNCNIAVQRQVGWQ